MLKWRIMDKSIETKVDTCVGILKFYLYCAISSQTSRLISVCIPEDLSMPPYRCRPHELRRGISGQTSLGAATSKSVRFARSLVIRSDGGQPHLHTCLSAQGSGRKTRVDAVRWHAGRSLSQLCIAYQRFNNMAVKMIHFPPVIPR